MELGNTSHITAIVVMCYLIGSAVKVSRINNKWIPVICGFSGAILGIIAYFFIPDIMPSSNIFDEISVGIISGLSATGINQITKQLCHCDKKQK